jgi:uncharacterized protein (DUF488 family)
MNKVVTIGVIGYDAERFFRALQDGGVDTLIDIRRRRAVRGREYAFANSQRLQARLAELGIRYLHRLDLAPTPVLRETQHAADHAAGVARRKRTELSPAFIAAFERDVLGHFDMQSFEDALPADAQTVALLCVEREPAACHRSLVADRLSADLGVPITHLTPENE